MTTTLNSVEVTHVVPLGMSCRVTYQLRTYFRSDAAYPFDWWISSMGGITRYLKNPNPQRIFSTEDLYEQIEDGWIHAIASRKFGFQLFHEFPRQKEVPPMRVVSPSWREHISEARSRHEVRLQRLLDLDDPRNTILFVRDKLDIFDDEAPFQDRVDDLWLTLKARWQHARIRLLLINVPNFMPPCQQVQHLKFDDLPGEPPEAWRGNDAKWAAAFASLGLPASTDALPLKSKPSPDESF
jgi:hypothetical protein